MAIVSEYLNTRLEIIQAMQLTHENAELLAAWCDGDVVKTYGAFAAPGDPKAPHQMGINFQGRNEWERLNEGEYLIKLGENQFQRVAAHVFEAVHEEI